MVFALWSSMGIQFFLEEATFSSLSIRPSTKALHNAFNIGLIKGTIYTEGLRNRV